MCFFSSKKNPYGSHVLSLPLLYSSKRNHNHLSFTMIKRRRAQLKEVRQKKRMKEKIEMKNLKLYMENENIIEENEKLRKQAMLLHKENQNLLSQLQKKLSEQNNNNNIKN